MNNTKNTIKQFIRSMNETWTSGHIDELECYFADDDMALVGIAAHGIRRSEPGPAGLFSMDASAEAVT
ncbi:MAG: hypothetical protein AAF446_07905 [Pseudomonadota bacterium]